MLIAVRAKVESVEHWRDKFKTHVDLFKSQGVSVAYMGSANDETVVAVFETDKPDEFIKIFNEPATEEAMSEDKITGGVEMFVLDETLEL
ncbi:hypothetical protein OA067_05515 [Gammaproteobacteria bacterium]|nr:hypothetical protein [Gammaproteobacteria bacterium]